MVAAETMVVGSMSSIVVSASSIPDSIISDLQPPHDDDHHQRSQLSQQQHQQHMETDPEFHRANPLIQQSLTSSIIPVQQMIVIHDSVGVPSHAEFTVPSQPTSQVLSVSQATSQVISMAPGTSQVISVPQSDSQVIPVPTINSQIISGTLPNSQVSFTVPVHQHANYNINLS